MKIRIDKTDKLFSKYIRTRDKWTCQRCGKKYPENSQGLHCSHFFGRARENTRFDPENADAICFGCHNWFHGNPNEYREWKLNRLGKEQFKKLCLRAELYCKRDRKLAYLYVKSLF